MLLLFLLFLRGSLIVYCVEFIYLKNTYIFYLGESRFPHSIVNVQFFSPNFYFLFYIHVLPSSCRNSTIVKNCPCYSTHLVSIRIVLRASMLFFSVLCVMLLRVPDENVLFHLLPFIQQSYFIFLQLIFSHFIPSIFSQ